MTIRKIVHMTGYAATGCNIFPPLNSSQAWMVAIASTAQTAHNAENQPFVLDVQFKVNGVRYMSR